MMTGKESGAGVEDGLDDRALRSSSQPRGTFNETFPLLSGALLEVQPKWEECAKLPGIQRITREQIQSNHDNGTELSSKNLLRRAEETFGTLTKCLADMTADKDNAITKWKGYFENRELADAKGQISTLTGNDKFNNGRQRYVDAEARRPGVLARFEEAERLLTESKALLVEVEQYLGEIKATKFLA